MKLYRRLSRKAWRALPIGVRVALDPLRSRFSRQLTPRDVISAYRVLLERRPASPAIIEQEIRASGSMSELRRRLLGSQEFRERNDRLLNIGESAIAMIEFTDGLRLWVDLADQAVAVPLIRGRFEHDEVEFVRDFVQPGDTVIDLGANIGLFTMVMAQRVGDGGTVYSFEPRMEIADLLSRSVDENGFRDRVRVERAAAGSVAGSMKLVYADDRVNLGAAHLVPDGSTHPDWMTVETVRVVALDDMDLPGPVRFIKMDIEGAEPLAIAGAQRLIQRDHPTILSEIHARQLGKVSGTGAADFIGLMSANGYACRTIQDGRPGAEVAGPISGDNVTTVLFMPR